MESRREVGPYDLGVSYADIGGQLGVHWRTVYRWGRG
ncbi:MAG TPA: helix-turn-helix domain-containing protein, partial [Myxococcales bacterium]|nr:helix-turn-helix domain-containing protein [Myxococcales bacterium]